MNRRYFVLTKHTADDGRPLFNEIKDIGGSPYIDPECVIPLDVLEPGDHYEAISNKSIDHLMGFRPKKYRVLNGGGPFNECYGLDDEDALNAARFRFGKHVTIEEIK